MDDGRLKEVCIIDDKTGAYIVWELEKGSSLSQWRRVPGYAYTATSDD